VGLPYPSSRDSTFCAAPIWKMAKGDYSARASESNQSTKVILESQRGKERVLKLREPPMVEESKGPLPANWDQRRSGGETWGRIIGKREPLVGHRHMQNSRFLNSSGEEDQKGGCSRIKKDRAHREKPVRHALPRREKENLLLTKEDQTRGV